MRPYKRTLPYPKQYDPRTTFNWYKLKKKKTKNKKPGTHSSVFRSKLVGTFGIGCGFKTE